MIVVCFFFNESATTEISTYWHTLSLPAALPICRVPAEQGRLVRVGRRRGRCRGGRGLRRRRGLQRDAVRRSGTGFPDPQRDPRDVQEGGQDRKSTRLNSSH